MSTRPVTTPTPSHLTLLLKHARSTVVLSALPETPLTTLKFQLLSVLSSRNIDHLPGSTTTPLPTSPEDLELGILLDKYEPAKGWVSTDSTAALGATKTGKKKTAASSSSSSNRTSIETVGDLELKDGAWIAYRVRGPRIDGSEDDDEIEAVEEDPGWNVEFPSFDDEEEEGMDGDRDGDEGYDQGQDEDEDMDVPIPVPRNAIAR